MGRSRTVLAILLLIEGCCLFANSIPSEEDTSVGFDDVETLVAFDVERRSPCLDSCHDDQDMVVGSVIGIDFGTSYSRVGFYKDGKVEIIPNELGNFITPSWVAFTDSFFERPLVGEAAKNHAAVNAQRSIFEINRLLGRKFEDKEVQSFTKLVPYKIVNKYGKPFIQVEFKDAKTQVFSPEEISAMILSKLKDTAEAFVGKKITNAVVPVPSYFSKDQRQATIDACIMAGLEVKLLHKPVAIAYAYGLHEAVAKKNILFVDIGEETFDVTIMGSKYGFLHYLADTHIGGDDYSQRIMEYFIKLIKNKVGIDVSNNNKALVKLRMEAERVKRVLSSQHRVRVELLEDEFETVTFEELINDLFMGLLKKATEEAPHQIDDIILTGGNTNIQKVHQLLRDYFNGKVELMIKGVSPEEAAAIGATLAQHPPIKSTTRRAFSM